MKFAVVKTGGKQYIVTEDKSFDFEKLDGEEGSKIVLEDILLVADGDKVSIGDPIVKGAKIEGIIEKQFKKDKVEIIKFRRKTGYRRKKGHRQNNTKVAIKKISW